jgi:hypothetical protein
MIKNKSGTWVLPSVNFLRKSPEVLRKYKGALNEESIIFCIRFSGIVLHGGKYGSAKSQKHNFSRLFFVEWKR